MKLDSRGGGDVRVRSALRLLNILVVFQFAVRGRAGACPLGVWSTGCLCVTGVDRMRECEQTGAEIGGRETDDLDTHESITTSCVGHILVCHDER
jgi:hypothetical protein